MHDSHAWVCATQVGFRSLHILLPVRIVTGPAQRKQRRNIVETLVPNYDYPSKPQPNTQGIQTRVKGGAHGAGVVAWVTNATRPQPCTEATKVAAQTQVRGVHTGRV